MYVTIKLIISYDWFPSIFYKECTSESIQCEVTLLINSLLSTSYMDYSDLVCYSIRDSLYKHEIVSFNYYLVIQRKHISA